MRRAILFAVYILAAVALEASDGVTVASVTRKPYTVLKITRYDGTVTYEVLKTKEMGIRAREIYEEYPIWKEAHRRARIQWNQWFWEKIPENAGREWILPKPKRPRFSTVGVYQDEFDAEDKVKALNRVEGAKMVRIKKQLRQNARTSRKAVAYLSNLEENRKLVRSLIDSVHEAMLAHDRRIVAAMSEREKKRVWMGCHILQQKAEQRLREKTVDENKNPVEPDVVDLYNALHDAIEPFLEKHKLEMRQWYMIWEEGYVNEWQTPNIGEEEAEMAAESSGDSPAVKGEKEVVEKRPEENPEREGVTIVKFSSQNDAGMWSAEKLLDGKPDTGWCSAPGTRPPHEFVFDLGMVRRVESVTINNSCQEKKYPGISAKLIVMQASTTGGKHWDIPLGSFALEKDTDGQQLSLKAGDARYVKVIILSNYGNDQYTEVMDILF